MSIHQEKAQQKYIKTNVTQNINLLQKKHKSPFQGLCHQSLNKVKASTGSLICQCKPHLFGIVQTVKKLDFIFFQGRRKGWKTKGFFTEIPSRNLFSAKKSRRFKAFSPWSFCFILLSARQRLAWNEPLTTGRRFFHALNHIFSVRLCFLLSLVLQKTFNVLSHHLHLTAKKGLHIFTTKMISNYGCPYSIDTQI